jgi:hypothetical protein
MVRLNNGIKLVLGISWGRHPFALHDRDELLLKPGINNLNPDDTAYWRAWLSDHQDSPLLESRFLYEM